MFCASNSTNDNVSVCFSRNSVFLSSPNFLLAGSSIIPHALVYRSRASHTRQQALVWYCTFLVAWAEQEQEQTAGEEKWNGLTARSREATSKLGRAAQTLTTRLAISKL